MLRSMAWAMSWTALVRSARPKSMMAVAWALAVQIVPEEVGGVEVVVGPEGWEGGQEGLKLGVKRGQEFEGLVAVRCGRRGRC